MNTNMIIVDLLIPGRKRNFDNYNIQYAIALVIISFEAGIIF
jgi:hypothetical protein